VNMFFFIDLILEFVNKSREIALICPLN